MRIYVAGASAELERAADVISKLKALGHEITEDWTAHVKAEKESGREDHELPEADRQMYSRKDLNDGVSPAELFILLSPPHGRSAGSWLELGFVYGLNAHRTSRPRTHVLVSGPNRFASIFTSLADFTFATDGEAIAFIQGRWPT